MTMVENENKILSAGGQYSPKTCTPRNKVAIIIPYRDREAHLKLFLRHMHPFLRFQQLDYTIFVVELVSTAHCVVQPQCCGMITFYYLSNQDLLAPKLAFFLMPRENMLRVLIRSSSVNTRNICLLREIRKNTYFII